MIFTYFVQICSILFFPVRFLTPIKEDQTKPKKKPQHNIDYHLTVRTIMEKIRSKFPHSFKSLRIGDFVKNSRSFVDSLLSSPEKLRQVLETLPSICEFCDTALENWSYKEAKAFLITLGHIREVKINVKICKSCRRSFYPEFYENGILFVHNKGGTQIRKFLSYLLHKCPILRTIFLLSRPCLTFKLFCFYCL